MISVVLKECRRCGTTFYDGKQVIVLEPDTEVTVVKVRLASCHHCPHDVNPRDIGFRRVY